MHLLLWFQVLCCMVVLVHAGSHPLAQPSVASAWQVDSQLLFACNTSRAGCCLSSDSFCVNQPLYAPASTLKMHPQRSACMQCTSCCCMGCEQFPLLHCQQCQLCLAPTASDIDLGLFGTMHGCELEALTPQQAKKLLYSVLSALHRAQLVAGKVQTNRAQVMQQSPNTGPPTCSLKTPWALHHAGFLSLLWNVSRLDPQTCTALHVPFHECK